MSALAAVVSPQTALSSGIFYARVPARRVLNYFGLGDLRSSRLRSISELSTARPPER
jgi:hypothetical protein